MSPPGGSDSNAGTLSQPFRTIQKCATTATGGGTCEVLAGTYHETVTPNSGITIEPFNGESVTVTGAGPVTGWSRYSRSIYKSQRESAWQRHEHDVCQPCVRRPLPE